MRKKLPKQNETRTRHFFALLPVTLGYETPWLEWVTVRQKYLFPVWVPNNGPWWANMAFVDPEEDARKTTP